MLFELVTDQVRMLPACGLVRYLSDSRPSPIRLYTDKGRKTHGSFSD